MGDFVADAKDVAIYLVGAGFMILFVCWMSLVGMGVIGVVVGGDLPLIIRIGIGLVGLGIVVIFVYLVFERIHDAKKEKAYFEKNKQ